jgi:hypothetical protein
MALKINNSVVINNTFTSIRIPMSADIPPFDTQYPSSPIKGAVVFDGTSSFDVHTVGTVSIQTAVWKRIKFVIPTPTTVKFSLNQDTGISDTDNITSDGTINVQGLNCTNGTWSYSTNGGSTWITTPYTVPSTSIMLDSGTYGIDAIQFKQTNAVGYTSSIASNKTSIIIDKIAPVITINTISGDDILTYADVDTNSITGTVNETVTGVTLNFNGTARTAILTGLSWSYLITEADLEALGEGTGKTIVASATDIAGNTGSASRTVRVNTWGSAQFTSPGTTSWTPPLPGIKKVHVVAIGGGGSGFGFYGASGNPVSGSGGGLGWKNNIAVSYGTAYTVVVGSGGAGGGGKNVGGPVPQPGTDSYFISATTVKGGGAGAATLDPKYGVNSIPGAGGSYIGDGGGPGGQGVKYNMTACSGGGAGRYTNSGLPGTNGGDGGSGSTLYGGTSPGGSVYYDSSDGCFWGGNGGAHGGGAGAAYGGNSGAKSGNGANGAVRIVWGIGRAFPNTNINT